MWFYSRIERTPWKDKTRNEGVLRQTNPQREHVNITVKRHPAFFRSHGKKITGIYHNKGKVGRLERQRKTQKVNAEQFGNMTSKNISFGDDCQFTGQKDVDRNYSHIYKA